MQQSILTQREIMDLFHPKNLSSSNRQIVLEKIEKIFADMQLQMLNEYKQCRQREGKDSEITKTLLREKEILEDEMSILYTQLEERLMKK